MAQLELTSPEVRTVTGANYEPLSPLLFLQRSCASFGSRPAAIHGSEILTFTQLYMKVVATAHGLKIQRGDRVAYLCANGLPLLVGHFAVAWAGGVMVPLNTRLHSEEVVALLKQVEAAVLIVDCNLLDLRFLQAARHVVVVGGNVPIAGTTSYTNMQAAAEVQFATNAYRGPPCERDCISINFTSGTTGQPRGVEISHRSAYLNALGECMQAELSRDARYLWVLPMFHCNGWGFVWAAVACGACQICPLRNDPDTIMEDLLHQRITHFCAAPIVLSRLAAHRKFEQLGRRRQPIKVLTAGAAPSQTLLDTYAKNNVNVIHVYGFTETLGPHTINIPPVNLQSESALSWRAGQQGWAGPHATFVRVVDTEMRDVPQDAFTTGEVVMRGNNVMRGYWRNSSATQEVFSGGWFHSGDAAVVWPNGAIEITDRLKDVIISGGENISSMELENVLLTHPAVADVAVLAAPDTIWGEVPAAVVEMHLGQEVTAQTLQSLCRQRLAAFKCPKHVVFHSLTRTSTGKINKTVLRSTLENAGLLPRRV